jgi:hypothetical protein
MANFIPVFVIIWLEKLQSKKERYMFDMKIAHQDHENNVFDYWTMLSIINRYISDNLKKNCNPWTSKIIGYPLLWPYIKVSDPLDMVWRHGVTVFNIL